MVYLSQLCRWQPSEIIALPIGRRKAIIDILMYQNKQSRQTNDTNTPRAKPASRKRGSK